MRSLTLLFLGLALCAGLSAQEPRYTAAGELIRPEGFREWVFAGASYAMSYNEAAEKPKHPDFHNIYLPRDAYQQFQKTGEFPDKTMLVMEVFSVGSQASINRQGHFEDRSLGVEVALKDTSRFPEKWAYFNFRNGDGPPLDVAKAFAKQSCWSCHNEHAASDNVFTQFYPVLRRSQ